MRSNICNFTAKMARRNSEGCGRYRLAAVVAAGPSIVGYGWNRMKPTRIYGWSQHAEHAALCRLKPGQNADLYVARVLANGKLAMSRPCPKCMNAIQDAGIKTIYYTNAEGQWERLDAA